MQQFSGLAAGEALRPIRGCQRQYCGHEALPRTADSYAPRVYEVTSKVRPSVSHLLNQHIRPLFYEVTSKVRPSVSRSLNQYVRPFS